MVVLWIFILNFPVFGVVILGICINYSLVNIQKSYSNFVFSCSCVVLKFRITTLVSRSLYEDQDYVENQEDTIS